MNNSNNIIQSVVSEPKDGMVRVFLSRTTFQQINQSIRARFNGGTPSLTYSSGTDASGKGIRKFTVDGIDIYSAFSRNEAGLGVNSFFISEADAIKLEIPRYEQKEKLTVAFSADSFAEVV